MVEWQQLETERWSGFDSFYTAALANGGAGEGKPGPREAYGPAWYSAYMRDPTGNKIGVYINWQDVKAG